MPLPPPQRSSARAPRCLPPLPFPLRQGLGHVHAQAEDGGQAAARQAGPDGRHGCRLQLRWHPAGGLDQRRLAADLGRPWHQLWVERSGWCGPRSQAADGGAAGVELPVHHGAVGQGDPHARGSRHRPGVQHGRRHARLARRRWVRPAVRPAQAHLAVQGLRRARQPLFEHPGEHRNARLTPCLAPFPPPAARNVRVARTRRR